MSDDLQLNLTPPVKKDGQEPKLPQKPAPDILYETFTLKSTESKVETAVVKNSTDA